ncbi:MAG TPA: acetolactate synthase large subunit [Ilumatobacteraceae bacterium]|nr:acetolactate synthase large subunit [Ilumatobacteraceae bacterium]
MGDADVTNQSMNGAESLLRTLVASGVEVCFANPGTSEMHFVSALDRVEGMRPVLGLFEGVVTGMADGYARMTEKPAATLLHLGPGLANGLANLHNARRAASPIVNLVGDHATYHAQFDAPLSSDIAGFARPVSGWLHASTSAGSVAADGARAVQAARQAPGQIATLIVPADVAWLEAGPPGEPLPVAGPARVSTCAVMAAAAALRVGTRTAILLRGAALRGGGLVAAGRIAAATGAHLFCDTFAPRLERGAGRVMVDRLPYFVEQLVSTLEPFEHIILVGSTPPVAFFAYPGKPSWCSPEGAAISYLAHPHEDGVGALEAVADELCAPASGLTVAPFTLGDEPTGRLDQFSVGTIVARLLPEGAIVSDEAATSGLGAALALATAVPHDCLSLTGGAIGQGLPLAAGAAVASPDRKVVCLHGDGGAMYTVQALWTMARERLDVTTVIFANRSYGILNIELQRVGAESGPKALSMLDIGNPNLDWVSLAAGMGVEAVRADTVDGFRDAFASAMSHHGPRLIEVVL